MQDLILTISTQYMTRHLEYFHQRTESIQFNAAITITTASCEKPDREFGLRVTKIQKMAQETLLIVLNI